MKRKAAKAQRARDRRRANLLILVRCFAKSASILSITRTTNRASHCTEIRIMATRRNVSSEKSISEKDKAQAPLTKSDITPAVPAWAFCHLSACPPTLVTWACTNVLYTRHVIYKLLGFTFAMAVVPIGSYFATLNMVFGGEYTLHQFWRWNFSSHKVGNSTWAGATAAIVANVVLFGYVLVAFREDQSEAVEAAEKARKELWLSISQKSNRFAAYLLNEKSWRYAIGAWCSFWAVVYYTN